MTNKEILDEIFFIMEDDRELFNRLFDIINPKGTYEDKLEEIVLEYRRIKRGEKIDLILEDG